MEFKNLKELERYINKQMAETLQNEVAEKVKDVEQRNIQEQVYEGYRPNSPDREPWKYERRRWQNGGLGDRNSMEVNVSSNGSDVELTVTNRAKSQDGDFEIAPLIEYGDGYNGLEYDYKNNRDNTASQYLKGRPFTAETIDELNKTNEHVTAFKQGMRKRGIEVK